MRKQAKTYKTLLTLLTALSVTALSSCSTEEPIDIDLTFTKTEAESTPAETTDSTYENTVTTSEQTEDFIPAETQPPQQTIPPDKRIPYEGLELSLSDAVEINEANDAFYDFSYIRYGSNFYMDSKDFDLNDFSIPSLQNIEYIKVEKGQEISNGLKVTSAQLCLSSYPTYPNYSSDIALSTIELEGSVTWEGFLWFYGDDEPIIGNAVLFAADPTKNDKIPIGIESGSESSSGPLSYSNDDFAFIMDSNSFFVGSIKDMNAEVETVLRENNCVRVRATLTNINLSCSSRASGYNHSHATITDVEILQ